MNQSNQNNQYYNKTSNADSQHKIQIEFPQHKENSKSITISKKGQQPIVISTGSNNIKSYNCNKTQNSQQNTSQAEPNSSHPNKTQQNYNFTQRELEMQEIAKQNQQIIFSNQYPISNSETIIENDHYQISIRIRQLKPPHQNTPITINKLSTIGSAIEIHNQNPTFSICVLNFSDPYQPGGGYLNGRSPQEETLCRQTLLYPTLLQSQMYFFNQTNPENVYLYDTMIYSPRVCVIRDDNYSMLNEDSFMVNVISAPAFDNRKYSQFYTSEEIMERRIRKIVSLAIDRQNDVIVLGAFGCGIFKNDPKTVSQIFKKILADEGLKNYFKLVSFPIYKSEENYMKFIETFDSNYKDDDEEKDIF